MEKVCVLGAGSTEYGKLADSIADITTQASISAIDSAGIDPKEIQAAYISNVFGVADKQVHLGPVLFTLITTFHNFLSGYFYYKIMKKITGLFRNAAVTFKIPNIPKEVLNFG